MFSSERVRAPWLDFAAIFRASTPEIFHLKIHRTPGRALQSRASASYIRLQLAT